MKKFEIYFQDRGNGGHLGFPVGTILAICLILVALILYTNFRIKSPSVPEKKHKIDFQDGGLGGHLGLLIGTILTFF